MKTIEITLPNETNNNFTYGLPDGFNRNNCICIGGYVINKNNNAAYDLLNQRDSIKLEYPGRISYIEAPAFNGSKCLIVMLKYM